MVTTRKIAAIVMGDETGCDTTVAAADAWAMTGSDAMGIEEIAFREVPAEGNYDKMRAYQRQSSSVDNTGFGRVNGKS